MAQKSSDKFKYGLLKVIDVSGFKVFDPVVRLLFAEEPKKQVQDIAKYMILPIIFCLICFYAWDVIGPRHKTKSGEVPTPEKVLAAAKDATRFMQRESEKETAFLAEGAEREALLEESKEKLAEFEEKTAELQKQSAQAAKTGQKKIDDALNPVKEEYDALKAKYKAAQAERKASSVVLSEKFVAKEASSDELTKVLEEDVIQKGLETEELKALAKPIDDIRSNPPKEIKDAQLAANKAADEVQHYKKVIDILTTGNREVKKEALLEKADKAEAALAAATTGKDALKQAKSVVSNKEKAAKTDEQKHPKAATIYWQTYRSLATVFVGFLIAVLVAVPVGIMCGLNRIVMACLTPIISIFRPVSPVVWLLIFQIIVGAFFPDPDKHWLFQTLNESAFLPEFIHNLQVNPAMIFSACTVAMCALWPALVNTALGVSSIDKDHLNVAKVLRLGFWSRLFKIIIPASLPLVFAGLRISLGVGWMVLIAAEALSSSDGLGKYVWDEYQNGSSQSFANIILACFVVGIIGFFLDRIMIMFQKLVSFDDGSATA